MAVSFIRDTSGAACNKGPCMLISDCARRRNHCPDSQSRRQSVFGCVRACVRVKSTLLHSPLPCIDHESIFKVLAKDCNQVY